MIKAKRGVLKGLSKNLRGECTYDSLLERNYILNDLETNSGIKEWTKDHGIRIPYLILGMLPHNYLPDFLVTYVDGSKEIHETKGAGFLGWISTHAKRRAGDEWCKRQGMIYRFIENSSGALFGTNSALDKLEGSGRNSSGTLDDTFK